MLTRFEFCRTDIRQGLMQPLAIVEDLNELENLGAGFVPREMPPVMDQLIFQCAEEALDRRVVIAIAFATPCWRRAGGERARPDTPDSYTARLDPYGESGQAVALAAPGPCAGPE